MIMLDHMFEEGESSVLRKVLWNTNEILVVEFISGKSYSYIHVPECIYTELVQAPSPGAYFNRHIKGVFQCDTPVVTTATDEILISKSILQEAVTALVIHRGLLREQKQKVVSELALLDQQLSAVGDTLDEISSKTEDKNNLDKGSDAVEG